MEIDARGYAAIGMSEYAMTATGPQMPPELIISAAGENVVRLRFVTVEGLDELEKRLRFLRATHFAVPHRDLVAERAAELLAERAAARSASEDLC
jgi:hypothetical protein